jgi:hypothetical protein
MSVAHPRARARYVAVMNLRHISPRAFFNLRLVELACGLNLPATGSLTVPSLRYRCSEPPFLF